MRPTLQSSHLADITKTLKNKLFFKVFAMLAMFSCSHLASKINEKSLKNLIEIKDIDQNFFKDEKYFLLDHLPKEMKPLLNLCWELI